jgi:hypothetical protein
MKTTLITHSFSSNSDTNLLDRMRDDIAEHIRNVAGVQMQGVNGLQEWNSAEKPQA